MEPELVTVEKKKKKRSHQDVNAPAPEDTTPLNVESKEERKKKKKHKKKQAEQQEESPVPVVEEQPVEQEGEKKKKKKKKQKREEQQASEEQPMATEEAPKEAKKEKHKNDHSNGQSNGHSNGLSNASSNGTGIQKDFYKDHPSMKNFSPEDVNKFRAERQMSVSFIDNSSKHRTETEAHQYSNTDDGFRDMKPIRKFEELVLPDPKMTEICKKFTTPTPIQSQCWPFILTGRDIIGIAETGSGKTLGFVLPALPHIKAQKPIGKKQGPIALILSPTRELALQTYETCEAAAKACGLISACFYGGKSKQENYENLKSGVHVLVATPGRLLDLIQEGAISLERVTYVVLDEADRMLDSGFEIAVRSIMKEITHPDKQTIMFSATWPTSIQNLAHSFLKNPVRVTIGSADLSANHRVTQIVEVLEPRQKDRRLLDLLRDYHKSRKNRILIFVLYKKEAPALMTLLGRNGYNPGAIHGDMSQPQREQALQAFKDGTTPLLIATDVAARGLDIPNVEYVLNYSFPLTAEDYVHRIGRTGRAGKTGISHTFFTDADKQRAGELVAILQEAGASVPDELRKLSSYGTAKKEHKMYGNFYKEVDTSKPMPKTSHVKFD